MKAIKMLTVVVFMFFALSVKAIGPDFSEIVEQVRESVVVIKTEVESRGRTAPGPSGSGFVIDDDGYVMTNRHVIHGVKQIFVQLTNNKVYKAELLGEDEGTDIAVLKIDAPKLKEVAIGDVARLKVGAWVIAYGAPFGLEHTVTAGIVSAKGRSLRTEQYVPFIQTDAAVNRGNSGGPLFNSKGEVVGINSQIFSMTGGNMGLAFSIPIDLAMEVGEQLKTTGSVQRGYLGVGYEEIDFEKAEAFGLKEVKGALINSVSKDSPAEKAGIRAGDVVLKIDGQEVVAAADLPFIVGRKKPDSSIEMMVLRDGDNKKLRVTIGSRPGQQVAASGSSSNNQATGLGMSLESLDDATAEALNISYGVVVRRVFPGPALDAGIREGDVLQMINQRRVNSVEEYEEAVADLPTSGTVAVLVVRRNQGSRFLVLRLTESE